MTDEESVVEYGADWVPVTTIYEGHWEWSEFQAHYSPSARRYFWYSQSGCSCNWWEDPESIEEWENGSREDLLRVLGHEPADDDGLKARLEVRNFKEPR